MSGELQTTEQRNGENLPADPRADLWAQAKAMAGSALVPQNFRNQPADCFIMADLALRLGVPLLPLLQETYVVHGKPAFSGKMAAALLEGSGRIKGPIDYQFFGDEGTDGYGCRCVVYDKALDKVIEGPRVTWAMVRAEKWDSNPKWKNLPDLMFRYRAASFLVRTQYSSLLMGMAMEDEVIDVQATPVEPPPATSKADMIAATLDAGDSPSTSGEAVEEPEPIDLQPWSDEIGKAVTLTAVKSIEDEAREKLDAESFEHVQAWCEGRRSDIREKRGQNSNETQTELI